MCALGGRESVCKGEGGMGGRVNVCEVKNHPLGNETRLGNALGILFTLSDIYRINIYQ